jgi:hypothetical protein
MAFAKGWLELSPQLQYLTNVSAMPESDRLWVFRSLIRAAAIGTDDVDANANGVGAIDSKAILRWANWFQSRQERIDLRTLTFAQRETLKTYLEPMVRFYAVL